MHIQAQSQLNLPKTIADEGCTSKLLSALLSSTVDQSSRRSESIDVKVFVALLRTCQPENRMLVRQALDILMPALP
ncbi:non-specific serine/threonine protein kinase [Trifolium repens]|nr:non-specific serine/threonine protein kinase [Trifolium repens]WJX67113.1 non-specific serine/threonine protein kinase [Trifolium repens]